MVLQRAEQGDAQARFVRATFGRRDRVAVGVDEAVVIAVNGPASPCATRESTIRACVNGTYSPAAAVTAAAGRGATTSGSNATASPSTIDTTATRAHEPEHHNDNTGERRMRRDPPKNRTKLRAPWQTTPRPLDLREPLLPKRAQTRQVRQAMF